MFTFVLRKAVADGVEEMEVDTQTDMEEEMDVDGVQTGEEEMEVDVEEGTDVEMEEYAEDMEIDQEDEEEAMVLG
nr:ribosomal biogenesis protein LAS1L-like isoform X1 [Taeniopygia guttata]